MKSHQQKQLVIISLSAALCLLSSLSMYFNWFNALDNALFDWQSSVIQADLKSDDNIVVIAIDDMSLNAMTPIAGRWVWPRSVHAELIEGLQPYSVQAIAFDILFIEPDIYRPDDDQYFYEVLQQSPHVFLPILALENHSPLDKPLHELASNLPLFSALPSTDSSNHTLLWPSHFNVNKQRLGAINLLKDKDGVARHYALFHQLDHWQVTSLPAAILTYLNIDLPPEKTLRLQWRGAADTPYKTFHYSTVYQAISAQDEAFLQQFSGKTILIGTTSAGLYDARHVAVNDNLPGIYILATVLDNISHQHYYQPISVYWIAALCIGVIFMIALIYAYHTAYSQQIVHACLLVFLILTIGFYASLWLLKLSVYVAFGTVMANTVLTLILFCMVFGYMEYLSRSKAQQLFGRFLDPNVVKQLLDEGKFNVEQLNQKKQVSILFSDIRNFTTLSEMHDANTILNLLNQYFKSQVDVIFDQHGTLDKFIGDCVMAFWGAPIDDPLHAIHAVRTALAMERNLLAFRASQPAAFQQLEIGIGIHCGDAIVGFIGTEQRVDYTVLGDNVNLASRIEGLTKEHNRILVSEPIMLLAQSEFTFEYQGEFSVKGRHETVKLYTPIRSLP
ncbi:adenylate cyclase [Pseudoalteromonas ulvae UL12]|uniref:adenylate/guanylate cyclase domain-containing protein n=1 Tax=Pseudoalteromonas ulvae TaxID=107327 RepID=UPI00186B9E68|nr:adenylate/guanylate cyclase domain-containing protein [Pseudoalteromonas ulvae]MBE0365575.1 adenylate cyclase [Pseudoalteromonas ulvae UL12]